MVLKAFAREQRLLSSFAYRKLLRGSELRHLSQKWCGFASAAKKRKGQSSEGEDEAKLLIVDGNGLLFPSLYAVLKFVGDEDMEKMMKVGSKVFLGKIDKAFRMTKPTHAVIVFDGRDNKLSRNNEIESFRREADQMLLELEGEIEKLDLEKALEVEKAINAFTTDFQGSWVSFLQKIENHLGFTLNETSFEQDRKPDFALQAMGLDNTILAKLPASTAKDDLERTITRLCMMMDAVKSRGDLECLKEDASALERQTTDRVGKLHVILSALEERWVKATQNATAQRAQFTTEKEYPSYKSGRETVPLSMQAAFPRAVEDAIKAGYILMKEEGAEADDFIGSLAKYAVSSHSNSRVFIVGIDKDFNQLISDRITVLRPNRGTTSKQIDATHTWCDMEWFSESFPELKPEQYVDLLALVGDKVDSVPGVPNVGLKRGLKLLQKHNSIENIIEWFQKGEKIPVWLKAGLENNCRAAILGKKLVKLDCDLPLPEEARNWQTSFALKQRTK